MPEMSIDQQVMMTLAALAYADETPLAGETVADQEARVLGTLNSDPTYGLTQVATTRDWQALWVGISDDDERSNLAFIAKSRLAPNTYAVAIRGTDFGLFMDKVEDFDVATMLPFAFPPETKISHGAQDAFAKVIEAICVTQSAATLADTSLVQALTQLIAATPNGNKTTIYVTGHSLGGAMATTLSLFLLSQHWPDVIFQVYTFAAPTAGDAAFAQAFDDAFRYVSTTDNSSWRVVNAFDVVPNAWQTLQAVEDSYYPPPGPAASYMVRLLIDGMGLAAADNAYVQPNQPGSGHAVVLNADYRLYDPGDTAGDLHAFLGQLAFQHGCNAYLHLLGAPLVKFAP